MVRVGLIGTGYAAGVRAAALRQDVRSHPISVAGHEHTRAFAAAHGLEAASSWQAIVEDESIDLVVVANVSSLHGEIVEAALNADKHVVVEYPLSLDWVQAERLLALAVEKKRLLHVEHIELLGGLHVAMQANMHRVGTPGYVSYRTLNPQSPAPKKWTYCPALFGFPFCGALSRVHRLTNLLGRVVSVICATRTVADEANAGYLKSIVSSARLRFELGGAIAEITYGKGEGLWSRCRDIEVRGSLGAMSFVGNEGLLTTAEGSEAIAVAPRKGLFVKDTEHVLSYLTEGTPLYVSAAESVYALRVGDALRRASELGETVYL